MAWNDKVSIGEIIGSSNHNEMIDVISEISSQTYGHIASSNIHFTSGQFYSEFYLSANTSNGVATVQDGDTIPHGLGVTPTYVSIVPSGTKNFGITCNVDDTNITVRMTAQGSWNVFWKAEK